MPQDAYVRIEGIEGDSDDKTYKGWIEVQSFSWGVHNTAGRVGTSNRPTAEDFSFTHLIDKASPNLFLACATGKNLDSATLAVRKGGGNRGEYLNVKLSDCFITTVAPHFQKELGDDAPMENVSLNFAKLDITETAGDGSVTETSFSFSKG